MKNSIKIMSSNICCWGNDENAVEKRMPRVKEIYKKYLPDIIGTQETTLKWKTYLAQNLSEYDVVGEPRDEYNGNPEHTVIMYKKERFDLIKSETFALSQSGEFASLGWGEEYPRICTYAHLKDKKTEKKLVFFNSHLALKNEARIEMLKLIIKRMNEFDVPIIFTGDFNTTEQSDSYKLCIETLDDSKYLAKNSDEGYTWHAYAEDNYPNHELFNEYKYSPIDYCLMSKGDFEVESYKIIRDKARDSLPISDHYPILVEATIK